MKHERRQSEIIGPDICFPRVLTFSEPTRISIVSIFLSIKPLIERACMRFSFFLNLIFEVSTYDRTSLRNTKIEPKRIIFKPNSYKHV